MKRVARLLMLMLATTGCRPVVVILGDPGHDIQCVDNTERGTVVARASFKDDR